MAAKSLTLVHGAAGKLGALVVDQLLAQGAAPATIVAGVRDVKGAAAAKLSAKGVIVRHADYSDKASLAAAYAGVDTVVFIPVASFDVERVTTADNAIVAAEAASIRRFVMVSGCNGRVDSHITLAPGYLYGESRLISSNLAWLIVRMGLFIENQVDAYKHALQSGTLSLVSSPKTRTPFISRADIARGVAAAALKKDLVRRILDIESSVAVSYPEIADILSGIAGKKVVFNTVTQAEFAAMVVHGLPDAMKPMAPLFAKISASFNTAADLGEITVTNDLYELTGKQAESVADFLKRELKK